MDQTQYKFIFSIFFQFRILIDVLRSINNHYFIEFDLLLSLTFNKINIRSVLLPQTNNQRQTTQQQNMKQTIKFLDVLDIQRKKSKTISKHFTTVNKLSLNSGHTQSFKDSKQNYRSLISANTKRQSQNINAASNNTENKIKNTINSIFNQNHSAKQSSNQSKFPFFKALHFHENKFDQYPAYLTQRDDFASFMYKNYENKLLSISKICQKQPRIRASDQKYFVSLYLQQLSIFQKIPQLIMDTILTDIKTKTYHPGDIIHDQKNDMKFMAVIFVGTVEFTKNKKVYRIERNEILMSQAFYKTYHQTIVAKEETVLLCIDKGLYKKLQEQLKQDIQDKNRAEVCDMMKSDFFIELHIKQKRAKQFYEALTPQFFFMNEQICEAGHEPQFFYLHFKGQILQQNHIYIRDHNKWPLPNRRWEVRAVYNPYQNQNRLHQFSFFGDEEIIGQYKFKSSYYAKTFCVLYTMSAQTFKNSLTVEDFKRIKKYRNEHVSINYTEFEQKVRTKLHFQLEKKKIIHKAINTSFLNKTDQNLSLKKKRLLEDFQSTMLDKSFTKDIENEQNKSFFS